MITKQSLYAKNKTKRSVLFFMVGKVLFSYANYFTLFSLKTPGYEEMRL